MENSSEFNPNWASNPGETISAILTRKKIPLSEFAGALNMDIYEAKNVLKGFIQIDEIIASRLSNSLGGSVNFWIQLQKLYDQYANKVERLEEQRWLNELPIRTMQRNGWIDSNENLLKSCLEFFNVSDVWMWRKKYSDLTALALFRKSSKFNSTSASVATWIRQGERQAEKLSLNKFNPELFISKIPEIKNLTRRKDPLSFLETLRLICGECGVALAIVPTPEGCTASGAAKLLDSGHGLIIVSFRYGTDDHFWFTFFHEVGHILLHGERDTFVDEDIKEPSLEIEEKQANEFAFEVLLPGNLKKELQNLTVSELAIREIANKAGVSLGIIVGQLQYLGKIKPKYFNGYKRRYNKEEIFEHFRLS